MKKILINARQGEEVRVALVDGEKLFDLDIEVNSQAFRSGSIYKASVSRVEPSLDAVFVNYGQERHGFLSLREIAREYFHSPVSKPYSQLSIAEVAKKGQELLVQVTREELGSKGAVLSTYVSLVGRYIVLTVNNARTRGISRRITGKSREEAYQLLESLKLESGEGVIVRTFGVGHKTEELQEDLVHLRELWKSIKDFSANKKSPAFLYRESSAVIRALRDYFNESIEEIVVDDQESFAVAQNFLQLLKPEYLDRLKLHQAELPLFAHYKIEEQITSAFQREVKLPSGGSIFFDQTEAMLAIDINSAKSTKGQGGEETARHTNVEAAQEVARQLRLRDAGGLIVIDFIDMQMESNKKAVENEMLKAMRLDKARYHLGAISDFGLLEMSRQKMRSSLGEFGYVGCPHCRGSGIVRTVESTALFVLRALTEKAGEEKGAALIVHAPVDVACYLLNEKHDEIALLEKQSGKRLFVLPDKSVEMPDYRINSYGRKGMKSSYQLLPQPGLIKIVSERKISDGGHAQTTVSYTQVVDQISKSRQAAQAKNGRGIWAWLKRWWGSDKPDQAASAAPAAAPEPRRKSSHTRHHRQGRRRRERPRGRAPSSPRASSAEPSRSSKLKDRGRASSKQQGSGLYRRRRREKLYNQGPIGRTQPPADGSEKPRFAEKPNHAFKEARTFDKIERRVPDPMRTAGAAAKDLSSNAPFRDLRRPQTAKAASGRHASNEPRPRPGRPRPSAPAMVQVKTKNSG